MMKNHAKTQAQPTSQGGESAQNIKNTPNELFIPKRRGRVWTEEQKRVQAAKIRRWKPWTSSTGPKTAAGKQRARWNAYKHGGKSAPFLRLRRAMALQSRFVRDVLKMQKVLANPDVASYKPPIKGLWEVPPADPRPSDGPHHKPRLTTI